MPITWRNVNNDPTKGAALLMRGATDSINSGLDAFKGVLTDAQQTQDDNYQNDQKNNTNEYLDAVAGYGSVDELEAGAGALDNLRASLGPNIDRSQIRGAVDNRENTLVTQENADYTREQNLLDRETAPILESIRGAIQTGDLESAAALTAQSRGVLEKSGSYSTVLGEIDGRGQLLKDRAYDKTQRGRTEADYQSNKGFDSLLAESLENGASELESRRFAQDNAARFGVDDSTLITRMSEVGTAYRSKNELSEEQSEELNTYVGRAKGTAELLRTQATTARDKSYTENPLDERYAFTDGKNTRFSDAASLASDQGFDDRGGLTYDSLGTQIGSVATEFADEMEMDADEKQLLGAFSKGAVELLGQPYEWIGKENLDSDALKGALKKVYDHYKLFKGNEVRRLDADSAFDADSQRALQVENSVGDFRKYLKKNVANTLQGK
jgi:hypothetical protein